MKEINPDGWDINDQLQVRTAGVSLTSAMYAEVVNENFKESARKWDMRRSNDTSIESIKSNNGFNLLGSSFYVRKQ